MREGTACLNQGETAGTGVGILDGTGGENDAVADLTVAGNFSAIAKHTVVAHYGVVADMGAFEQEVIVADYRATILIRATVDDHILTNHIVITDLHVGFGTTEFEVLRQGGDHRTLVDLVVVADTRTIADRDEGEDDTVVADLHIVLDIDEGEYLTVVADLCLGANLSFWTYFTCHNFQN